MKAGLSRELRQEVLKGMTEVQAGSFVYKKDVEICKWEEMSVD